MAKELGIAISTEDQREQDIQSPDLLFVNFLLIGKKISKIDAVKDNDDTNKMILAKKNITYPVTIVRLIFQRRSYAILCREDRLGKRQ